MKNFTAEIKHGDCLEVLSDYSDNTFDLIVTSPPYADKRQKTYGGHKAKERSEEFQIEYGKVINRFTAEFIKDFCKPDGTILWNKLVEYNSGASR